MSESKTVPEEAYTVKAITDKLLTINNKSTIVYEAAYQRFIKWCSEKNADTYSEDVLLEYFTEMAITMKSSSVWSQYSMVKSLLHSKHDVDISKYLKLRAYLKKNNEGYIPKKARVLTKEQLDRFLSEAPDEKYLGIKVILIIGISGSCRCDELVKLKMENIEDLGSLLLVKVPDSKTHRFRTFSVVGDEYISIYRKYVSLRPAGMNKQRFFLKYLKGVCYRMVMGVHKIGSAAKEVAAYLKLPNWKEYTGHCLRLTSPALLLDGNVDVTRLNRYQERKPRSVAKEYVEEPLEEEKDIKIEILSSNVSDEPSNEPKSSSCDNSKGVAESLTIMNEIINADISSVASSGLFQNANLNNCTINLYFTNKVSGQK